MSNEQTVAVCPVCDDRLDDPKVTAEEWRCTLSETWCERCWGPR
jgi:hypothetical protein